MEIKTPSTTTTRLRVSTSDDMAMKQSESSRKLSEMASFNVMGYLRNSGWVRNDSAELHQKYVDNMLVLLVAACPERYNEFLAITS